MHNKNIHSIIALFSSNKFQDALNAIEELIVDNPNDALIFNIRGACYAGLDQKNLAKENYEKAIAINPEYAKAHYNLAGALHELDEFEASIQSYEDALAIEPDYAEAQNNLGVMYADGKGVKKDDAQAAEWYRKAAEQGHAGALFSLGVMHFNGEGSVKRDEKQAILLIRKAAEQGHKRAKQTLKDLGESP